MAGVLPAGRVAGAGHTSAVRRQLAGRLGGVVEGRGRAERTPFLISPTFEYDVELNAFFRSGVMVCAAWNTARDLKVFLNFLWRSRDGKSWRDATEADHVAYLTWRRKDTAGPRVDDATWDLLQMAGESAQRAGQPDSAARTPPDAGDRRTSGSPR
jgi:hypothetical protein